MDLSDEVLQSSYSGAVETTSPAQYKPSHLPAIKPSAEIAENNLFVNIDDDMAMTAMSCS
jgi:hypothetical protein